MFNAEAQRCLTQRRRGFASIGGIDGGTPSLLWMPSLLLVCLNEIRERGERAEDFAFVFEFTLRDAEFAFHGDDDFDCVERVKAEALAFAEERFVIDDVFRLHVFELKPFDKFGFQKVAELGGVFHGSSVWFMVNGFDSGKSGTDIDRSDDSKHLRMV